MVLYINQVQCLPTDGDLDSDNLKTASLAEDLVKSQLDKIKVKILVFSGKCADQEFYNQMLKHLTELFLIIEQQLRNNEPSKMLSTHSIAAQSKIFQICVLLATNTTKNSSVDLKRIYLPVSKIFKWDPKIQKKLLSDYKKKYHFNVAKGWITGPVGLCSASISFFFTVIGFIKFSLHPKKGLWGKDKDEDKRISVLESDLAKVKEQLNHLVNAFLNSDNSGFGRKYGDEKKE